jgi:hypothetical protein
MRDTAYIESSAEQHFGVRGCSLGEVLRALNSEDPQAIVTERQAELDALEDWALTEIAKWRHALAIAEAGR